MDERKFEIINGLGIISTAGQWNKELNRISWNGREPEYDIRSWTEDHERMTKGITFSEQELRKLFFLIEKEIKFLDEEIDG